MGDFSKSRLPEPSKKQDAGTIQGSKPTAQLKDNRAEHAAQLKFASLANSGKGNEAVQRAGLEEEEIQMKGKEEEELQLKAAEAPADPVSIPVQRAENKTGLPDQLKSGVENLSGYRLDDVRVHYNSDKPSQLQAHAYAQGSDIHVAPGQEKHLPHEAWHVVQQKQGRVKATRQLKGKANINDDAGLETEADVMGARAVQAVSKDEARTGHGQNKPRSAGENSQQFPIQRNEESTQVLEDMAEPKVGQQDIELSKQIHTDIEKIYSDTIDLDYRAGHYNGAVCLGGIVLPSLNQYNNLGSLVQDCTFVNLGKGALKRGIYELLPDGLKKDVVLNTLLTMYDAGQLDYLWYSKFGGEKRSGWKVVVEVHYYRNRESSDNVFHKDTLGKTLFVNLNYLNKKKIVGPEYVVNPPDDPNHLQKVAETLPKEFLKDRKTVMGQLKDPQIIEVVEVPEYGYVAFVDEIIHHSSPTTKHREVKGEQVHEYLLHQDKKQYKLYRDAYRQWSKKPHKPYDGYVKKKYRPEAPTWKTFFDNNDPNTLYDRNQIRAMDPNKKLISDVKIDEMLHSANYLNFGQVSIPNPDDINSSFKSPMTKTDKPLERRMSMNLDSGTMGTKDKEVDGRRSFFRTWVRAEKQDVQVTKDDWKWTQVQ